MRIDFSRSPKSASVMYSGHYPNYWNLLICCSILIAGTRTTTTTPECRNITEQIIKSVVVLERCSYFCWNNCWCNVTREVPETRVTKACKATNDSFFITTDNVTYPTQNSIQASSQVTNNCQSLSDPEVAAIAVIASLVFSIAISVSVFFIQRQHRSCVERKSGQQQPLEVVTEPLSGSSHTKGDGQHIQVAPSNKTENVYEDMATAEEMAPMISCPAARSDPHRHSGTDSLGYEIPVCHRHDPVEQPLLVEQSRRVGTGAVAAAGAVIMGSAAPPTSVSGSCHTAEEGGSGDAAPDRVRVTLGDDSDQDRYENVQTSL